MVGVMSGHLEPVPDPSAPPELEDEAWEDWEPLVRPAWWRWVAIVVVLAMVVATPFVYLLSRLLD